MKRFYLGAFLLLGSVLTLNAQNISTALRKAAGKPAVTERQATKQPLKKAKTEAEKSKVSTHHASESVLKSRAASGTPEALTELGTYYLNQLRFSTAEPYLIKAVRALQAKRLPWQDAQKLVEACRLGAQMLRGTEKIAVIDSFVVEKKDFLKAYKLSASTGSFAYFNDFFQGKLPETSTVYRTEFGDKIYYAKPDSTQKMKLFTSDNIDNKWSVGTELQGIGGMYTEENYPFMCGDGVTLYFASKGPGSIGGYDLFVTRAGEDNTHFLKADNMGLPYNSPANDYLLVDDEYNNLGWFASDRFQPEGKVCVYVFVPNESRVTFDYDKTDPEVVRKAAGLFSIKSTQTDPEIVKKGKEALAQAFNAQQPAKKRNDFELVINDNQTYTSYKDFHTQGAKDICAQWVATKKNYEAHRQLLDSMRDKYAKGSENVKQQIAQSIIALENQTAVEWKQIKQMEVQMRNMENQAQTN